MEMAVPQTSNSEARNPIYQKVVVNSSFLSGCWARKYISFQKVEHEPQGGGEVHVASKVPPMGHSDEVRRSRGSRVRDLPGYPGQAGEAQALNLPHLGQGHSRENVHI